MYTNMTALEEMNPDWEYPRAKVHIEKYVGKGAFCVVAKALVDDLGIVAVKIPKGETKQVVNMISLSYQWFAGRMNITKMLSNSLS